MAQEDVELVRSFYEMIATIGRTGDEFVDPEDVMPDLWARVHPDAELHERPDLPDAKVYRGKEKTKEFWRKSQEIFDEMRWKVGEIKEVGGAVVADTRVWGRGRGSEIPIEVDEINVFWFRDGMLAKVQAFPTMEEALAAVESEAGAGG
jgi:ketosteroid isomerase-like protein